MDETTGSYEWGTLGRTTLHAIREIHRERGAAEMEISTQAMLAALAARAGPWADLWEKEPRGHLTQIGAAASRLASILRPYRIDTRTITGRIRGFVWEDFENAWQLHLPPINGENTRIMELMRNAEEHSILEWVAVCKMYADKYQRPVNQHEVDRIAQNWDFNRAGTVDLSLRDDGDYYVIDGWRRACAARILGVIKLPARVYLYLKYREEAELFLAKNSTKHPTAIDRFRAKVEIGEDAAVGIVRILGVYHLAVGIGPGEIRAVRSLEKMYTRHGRDTTAMIIELLHEAWGQDPGAYTQLSLGGMDEFFDQDHYKEPGVVDLARIVQQLKRTGIGLMYQRSGVFRGITMHPPSAWGHALHEVYNAGLRKHLLPPWIDKPRRATKHHTPSLSDGPQEAGPQAAHP